MHRNRCFGRDRPYIIKARDDPITERAGVENWRSSMEITTTMPELAAEAWTPAKWALRAVAAPPAQAACLRGPPPEVRPRHAALRQVRRAAPLRPQRRRGWRGVQVHRVAPLRRPRQPHALHGQRLPLRAPHRPRLPRRHAAGRRRPLLRALPGHDVAAPAGGLPHRQPLRARAQPGAVVHAPPQQQEDRRGRQGQPGEQRDGGAARAGVRVPEPGGGR